MGSPAKGTGPLAGVRVVDLTAMVMGPYCTQIMADMGADVIKVEPPNGDDTRYISVGPAPGMSGVFVNVNRGKRSVILDLRSATGVAAMRGLIERARAIAPLASSGRLRDPIRPQHFFRRRRRRGKTESGSFPARGARNARGAERLSGNRG